MVVLNWRWNVEWEVDLDIALILLWPGYGFIDACIASITVIIHSCKEIWVKWCQICIVGCGLMSTATLGSSSPSDTPGSLAGMWGKSVGVCSLRHVVIMILAYK